MIDGITRMIQNINDWNTPLGKVGLTLDGVGVALSVGFYGCGLGNYINEFAPPIILVLTIVSLSTSVAFKISSEYRAWIQRKSERKKK
jgi:p-aminobenzoyl-glutamate transporter AbgT